MDPMIDLDRELSRSIQVDPSPDLAARVRARIASEPRAWHWSVPKLAIAAIGAIAVGIIASTVVSLNHDASPPATPIVLEHQDLILIAPLHAALWPTQRYGTAARPPEVIISKSEMLALQQLFSGTIVAPPATPVAGELAIEDLVIESIAMPPIPEGERQ
jgi:hypothetical protein